jgi:hypothetical protein
VRLSTVHSLNRRSIEINPGVDNQQWVVIVDDIVVHGNTIEVLLQQRFEEHIFFFGGSLLLLDCKLVQQNLVVPSVEVVEKLELIVLLSLETFNFLDANLGLVFHTQVLRVIERLDLLLFGFKLSAELCCFQNFLS